MFKTLNGRSLSSCIIRVVQYNNNNNNVLQYMLYCIACVSYKYYSIVGIPERYNIFVTHIPLKTIRCCIFDCVNVSRIYTHKTHTPQQRSSNYGPRTSFNRSLSPKGRSSQLWPKKVSFEHKIKPRSSDIDQNLRKEIFFKISLVVI